MGRDDLRVAEEGGPGVLSVVVDHHVLRPVEVGVLEVVCEAGCLGHVEVVGVASLGGLGEAPELIIVKLRTDQRRHHREGSPERSVGAGVDDNLVGEGSAVAGPGDVDVVHVSGGDLGPDLGDEIQDELDIVRLALL